MHVFTSSAYNDSINSEFSRFCHAGRNKSLKYKSYFSLKRGAE